jgi:hypothetical protein
MAFYVIVFKAQCKNDWSNCLVKRYLKYIFVLISDLDVKELKDFIPTDLFHCRAAFLSSRPEFGRIFRVESGFVPSEGSYACRIDPNSDESVLGLFLSGEVEIFVRPGTSLASHNANIQGDSLTLPFLSAFKVFNRKILLRDCMHCWLLL